MFGYATDETEECMPLTVVLAHRLNAKIAALRRSGEFWWARPDSKTQVTMKKQLNMVNINAEINAQVMTHDSRDSQMNFDNFLNFDSIQNLVLPICYQRHTPSSILRSKFRSFSACLTKI